MLWELSVAEQRYRAVLEVGAGVPVNEVAERYGVSRQSVHTWLRRSGSGEAENRSPSGRLQQSLVTSNCVSDRIRPSAVDLSLFREQSYRALNRQDAARWADLGTYQA
jgi:hypothetical protein